MSYHLKNGTDMKKIKLSNRPYGVAITGGIGSGKTTATKIFSELGVSIIDVDEISKQATSKGGSAINEIRKAFGEPFIKNESMDRDAMREEIFFKKSSKLKLEEILYPIIRAEVENSVLSCSSTYYALAVPMLFESGSYLDLADRTLVIDCSETSQLERVSKRSGLRNEMILAIMASQMTRTERLALANDVIDNDGDWNALKASVLLLHEKYLDEATTKNSERQLCPSKISPSC